MAHFFAAVLALLQAAPAVPPTPLDARWVVTFDAPPAAAPGFDESTAYVPLKLIDEEGTGKPKGGQLVAVNLDRGTIRWRLDLVTPFTPATGDGLVFIVNEQTIEARDAADGRLRWKTPLPGGAAAPLFWDTGWLLASTASGDLAAFRAADGTLVWRQQLGAPLARPPGPALDRLYLPLADNRVVAVSLLTGETMWTRPLTGVVTSMLALDDQLFIGTSAKYVMSLELSDGDVRWSKRIGGDIAGTPSADDKRIYYATRENVLWAVDRKSGNLRWKADLASRPAGGPLRLPDILFMPLVSNQITGFDPVTGKPTVTVVAAGEVGAQPYFRANARVTSPRLITVSREGQLQGFGRRFEPVPQLLDSLPGAPAVP